MVKGEELGGAMIGLLNDEKVKNLVNTMLKLDSKVQSEYEEINRSTHYTRSSDCDI